MKQLLAVAVIALSAIIIHRVYQDRLREQAPKAPANTTKPILVSEKLEPTYADLVGEVSSDRPYDLVPPIHVMKERIEDKKAKSTGAAVALYGKAVELATAMEDVAEERTRVLTSMVNHVSRGQGPLDSPQGSKTGEFFAQSVKSRWDAELRRRKPALEQLFASLRSQEREWNKAANNRLQSEDSDIPTFVPPTITANPSVNANPLEKGAYGRNYPWRRRYYEQYGYSSR
jgi:hypothetical protein